MQELLEQLIDASLNSQKEWGVEFVQPHELVYLWDKRDDADAAIIAAVGVSIGLQVECECYHRFDSGTSIQAALFKASDEAANELRTAYFFATQADPEQTEPPF